MSNFIEYDRTGRVCRISKTEFSHIRDNYLVMKTDSNIIKDIVNDKLAMDSVFVWKNEILKKDGTIYLPKAEDEYTDVLFSENTTEPADIKLEFFTDNKLLDITINKLSLRLWYHHKMKDKFSFGTSEPLMFLIKKGKKIVKELNVPINDFLETFKTTIDLSDIKLNDISVSTKKILPKYIFTKQSSKPTKRSTGIFDTKSDGDANIEIEQVNNELLIKSNIKNPNKHKIFDDIHIYLTADDPNILYKNICIPVRDLWFNKEYKVDFRYNIEDVKIFCNLNNIKIKVKNEKITE